MDLDILGQDIALNRKRKNSDEEHEQPRSDAPGIQVDVELKKNIMTAGRDIIVNVQTGSFKTSTDALNSIRGLALWLSPRNQHVIHKDIFDKVMPGTGQWIFEEPAVKEWLDRTKKLVWATGIPGAGKTCISSIIINHLTHVRKANVVFLYCQYNDQPSVTEALACLLRQMVESSDDAADHVRSTLYALCHRNDTSPSRSELEKTLKETLQKLNDVFLVVDALDELADNVCHELVFTLVSLEIPLLLTSRPLPNLVDVSGKVSGPDVIIRAQNDDLRMFIVGKLNRAIKLRPLLRSPDARDEIARQIEIKCDRMFLLASLQTDVLASGHIVNTQSLRKAVDQLPSTLNDLYEITLHRVNNQSKEEQDLAFRALTWVIHSKRLLKIKELLEALTVDDNAGTVNGELCPHEERLVSVCVGLMTIEKETETIKLIHLTAQEFFSNQGSKLFKAPHAFIANTCGIYLSCVDVDLGAIKSVAALRQYNTSFPLLSYACYFLGYHTHHANFGTHNTYVQLTKTLASLFQRRKTLPLPLPTKLGSLWGSLPQGYAPHFAAANGLVPLLEELVSAASVDINAKMQGNRTVLHIACITGHVDIVQYLLGFPHLEINVQDEDGQTPLHFALQQEYRSIVQLLLSAFNAGINAKDNLGQTPLHHVTQTGHDSALLLLLNSSHTNINAENVDGQTPLHCAAQNNHTSTIKLILSSPDVRINPRDNIGQTPLHYAAQHGYHSVLQLLLASPHIDANAKDQAGCAPLHLASKAGHSNVLQILLKFPSIDINAKSQAGFTAWHYAIQYGQESTLKVLLSSPNIDVHAEDKLGWSPLHLAAAYGLDSIVKLLLDSFHMDINAENKDGETPLHFAAQAGHDSVLILLLQQPNINVNAKDPAECTPLYFAVECEQLSSLLLLLAHPGIDINAQDQNELTPLHHAARNRYNAAIQILVRSPNIDANAREGQEWTPLHYAAVEGDESTIQCLLDSPHIDVNATDEEGLTALHFAAQHGHVAAVECLLHAPGINPHVRGIGSQDGTPLELAQEKGHDEVVAVFREMEQALG